MSVSIFDSFLTTTEIIRVFDDAAVIQAMLQFEKALALAQAAEGIIPKDAAQLIARHCDAQRYDIPTIVTASRRAGSIAIPLVKDLINSVAMEDKEAARHVHWGSTSQDVIDTATVLVTRDALVLLNTTLSRLIKHLLTLAENHLNTPVLARTLMQPAQVTSLGFKFTGWVAPLVRAQERLRVQAQHALQLQLGGAVGTLAVMGEKGPAVVRRVAAELNLAEPQSSWQTQRDEWVRLGLEVAVLVGSLGKIAKDLSLMAQGEIAELAEPTGKGRGGSSAMPHKRNPVSCMTALAVAGRVPQHAAALLANMGQEHERGLGNWQAELAEWPQLFVGAHGALAALTEAIGGLQVDNVRMLRNIDALHGLVFAEAVTIYLANAIGRPQAHQMMEELTRHTIATGEPLRDVVASAIKADPVLHKKIDLSTLDTLFDAAAATTCGAALARRQLPQLRAALT